MQYDIRFHSAFLFEERNRSHLILSKGNLCFCKFHMAMILHIGSRSLIPFGNQPKININFTSNASVLNTAETIAIENSYSSSSMVPLSLPKSVNHCAWASGSKVFLTACWIVFAYFYMAALRFVDFSAKFQKTTTSSSVFKWIFFLSFWILFMISLANPLIFNSSFCLVSRTTMTLSPPMASYSWMFSTTNLSLIMMSS